uniref:Uncharacterized protein n=1 Tax=Oryza barthii TaxID=65489 RepID=A0A0D3H5C5_9ORYZ
MPTSPRLPAAVASHRRHRRGAASPAATTAAIRRPPQLASRRLVASRCIISSRHRHRLSSHHSSCRLATSHLLASTPSRHPPRAPEICSALRLSPPPAVTRLRVAAGGGDLGSRQTPPSASPLRSLPLDHLHRRRTPYSLSALSPAVANRSRPEATRSEAVADGAGPAMAVIWTNVLEINTLSVSMAANADNIICAKNRNQAAGIKLHP